MARRTGLSLRTIQRIESGETEPRGDTLIRVAGVFDLKPDELFIPKDEVRGNFIPVLNLSALTFIIFPLLGFLTRLLIWLLKKDKTRTDEKAGRDLLNFQVTWGLTTCSVYVLGFFGVMIQIGKLGRPESFLVSLLALYLLIFIFILFNIVLSIRNKPVFYQPAIPFLR